MGRPVMVDDGGSIRIKLALEDPDSAGVMDSLFDVENHQSEHNRNSPKNDAYSEVLLFYLDVNGDLVPATPAAVPFESIKIFGDSNMEVEVSKNPPGTKLKIKLIGDGLDPAIESKQHKNKRSYVVSNAGRIEKVAVTVGGGTQDHNIPSTAIYTSVVIR
jgi:hypothetical protein